VEEEGGEEDTEHEERERDDKNDNGRTRALNRPRKEEIYPPDDITDCCDSYVDVSELCAETDSVVFTTTANVRSGESEGGYSGEDNEGGMSVEDLQRGFIKDVQSGEEREKQLGKK